MIYTITINPSLDIILEVEELVYDDINKVVAEKKRASGKGIDISRNIKALGGESIALGLIGGFRGLELESMLLNEGIVCDFTRISSETKSNIILQQKKKRIKTFLTTPDPVVSSLDLSLFLKKIRDIPEGSYVIISSAYSETIDRFVYHQIISTLNERGVKTILDGDGDILKHCINARPFMIKPNIYEFSRLMGKKIIREEEIVEHAKTLLNMVNIIVVSMGAKGAIVIQDRSSFLAMPPKVKVKNSIGAGDAFLAGMVHNLHKGGDIEEALVYGVACGTASTLNESSGACKKEDVDEIKKVVIFKKF